MTTDFHTPHSFGAPVTAAEFNGQLGELDAAIGAAIAAGFVDAATTLDAQAASGQKVLPVASTVGFIVGDAVWVGTPGSGLQETGVIASISAGVSLTLVANLGSTHAVSTPVSRSPAEIVDARGTYGTLGGRVGVIESRVFDPRAYGTMGTADDTTPINAAIIAANAAGGGRVLLPDALCLVTQVVMKSYVELEGHGYNSVLKVKNGANSASPAVITLDSTTNVTIRNLRLAGNKANQTEPADPYTWGSAIYGTDCDDVVISRVWIADFLKDGVFLCGANNEVSDCMIEDLGTRVGVSRSGIVFGVDTPGTGGKILRNTITDVYEHAIKLYAGYADTMIAENVIDGATDGIVVNNCSDVSVVSNTVRSTVVGGINVYTDGTYAAQKNNKVIGNTVIAAGGRGITVLAGATALQSDADVSHNYVSGCTGDGIYVLSVPRSTIAYNKTMTNLSQGIYLDNSPNSDVSHNICRNNAPNGITIWADTGVSNHSRIIGNRCYDDGTGTQTFGIRVADAENLDIFALNDSEGSASDIYIPGGPDGHVIQHNIATVDY